MNDQKVTKQDLELIYDLYFDRIYKFFYYKILSKEIAEDLTSETFIAYADVLKAKKNVENLKSFLFGIAKNIFLKYLKQKYKQEIPFSNISEDFYEYAEKYVEESEKKENLEDKILKFLKLIPDKQQLVIKLRLIEKLSLQEICIKLGKDMNYVKTTQKRGLRSLKDAIATNMK